MKAGWLLALAVAAGCSATPPGPASSGPAADAQLTATLVSPTDITLEWRGPASEAGVVVEFATEPAGRYTILEFLPPGRTTFTHPDLMPRTPFYYRIRPVLGSAVQDVAPVARNADVATFRWADTAGDEEGYLVEVKPPGRAEFRVAAVTDPNVTAYDLTTLPEEQGAAFRVRAFRFGTPSNLASATTGDEAS